MEYLDSIELELWRFRSIADHDKALEAVKKYVEKIVNLKQQEQ